MKRLPRDENGANYWGAACRRTAAQQAGGAPCSLAGVKAAFSRTNTVHGLSMEVFRPPFLEQIIPSPSKDPSAIQPGALTKLHWIVHFVQNDNPGWENRPNPGSFSFSPSMIKYIATAVALKGFSCGPQMRGIYRWLGNRFGNRRRGSGRMPDYYADRVKRMLRLNRQHGIVRDGDCIFELGTGWLHWEALTLRLFFDIKAVLYDVWDNRQLGGLKNYLRQLGPLLNNGFELSPEELQRAQSLIEAILKVESFAELYKLLGFEYVVESSGSLSRFADGSFQLVVSAGVLEHVDRGAVPAVIPQTRRILRPNGWAVHSIDTSDHLAHYDGRVSKKRYLSSSEFAWKWLWKNKVQEINRLQRGEWLELFKANGFDLVEEEARPVDIGGLKLAPRYSHMDEKDLGCTVLRLALRART